MKRHPALKRDIRECKSGRHKYDHVEERTCPMCAWNSRIANYWQNRERILKVRRKWTEANRDKIREHSRKWREKWGTRWGWR